MLAPTFDEAWKKIVKYYQDDLKKIEKEHQELDARVEEALKIDSQTEYGFINVDDKKGSVIL